MNKILISLVCFVFLIGLSGVVSGATKVSSCQTINSSGEYVLNQSINSSSTCIRIEASDVVFDGQGYNITGPGNTYGIYVYKSGTTLTNVTVRNTTITGLQYGIYYRNAENGWITDNTASNNEYGILVEYSSNYNTISNNIASNNDIGIYLDDSSNYNTISNNTANSNEYYGIYLYSSSGNTITGNTASNNDIFGIYLDDSSNYNTIESNTASGNTKGMYDNSGADSGGIYLDNSDSNTIKNNTASNNEYGIGLYSSSNNTIKNNIANSNEKYSWEYTYGNGIHLLSSSSNTITNNTANSNNKYGIYLSNSSDNTITGNTANSNYYEDYGREHTYGDGIRLDYSSNNTITNNNVSNNWYGIDLLYSSSNNLKGNNMSANTYNFGIYGSSTSHYIQDIDITNKVDGKPIYYLVGVSDLVIDSSTDAGYVGVINSVNVTVKDLTLTKNGHGMLFLNTTNSSVLNVNASNNKYGIYLDSSGNNTLTNNNANSNNWNGIRLESSSKNTISNNTANSNEYYGIYLDSSSGNTITGNTANSNNGNGIVLGGSSKNTLTGNTVNSNNNRGIWLSSSSSNTITNNLFNNTNNVYYGGTVYSITWNTAKTPGTNIIGGPYLGGNFWAHPSGTGFSETCTDADGDGICDSNYWLTTGNVDYLPLAVAPPSIDISKTMTAGKTTVNTGTKEYWVLEIEVINDGPTDLGSVVVSDTIPAEITLDDFTVSKGSVATTVKNGATKLAWTIGTMSPGDIETLVLDVSTRTDGSTQYFLEPGEYVLNEGASVSGNSGQITAGPTDPITVYAQTAGRSRMGGGRSGGHHRRGR